MAPRAWALALAAALATAAGCGKKGDGASSPTEATAGGTPVDPPAQQPPAQTPPPAQQPPPVSQPPPVAQPPPGPSGPAITFGTQGPWPVDNVTYGASDGIRESWVVGIATDEAENRWVATNRALYLMRPGDRTFRRLDEHDGLHLGDITGLPPGPTGWAKYCDLKPIPADAPCNGSVAWGGANQYGILSVEGGSAGEVFVGYNANHPPDLAPCPDDPGGVNGYDWCDPMVHSGKVDRVRLQPDGSITVDRFDFMSSDHGRKYWHNRYANRLAYDHFVHHGTLYVGTEHGVDVVFPDRWTPFTGALGFDAWSDTWYGDHLHARVCFHAPCDATSANQRMGGWHGLDVDRDGQLWHAGWYTAGRISWVSDPTTWWNRNGNAFTAAFGDPYAGPGTGNEPVFQVAQEGDAIKLSGVAVCPDGSVWFSSWGPETGTTHTVARWTGGGGFQSWDATSLGLGEQSVQDIACLPDGRIVLAGPGTGLAIWDPARQTSRAIHGGQGIPCDQVNRVQVDRMTSPPSILVGTACGAAVLRVLP